MERSVASEERFYLICLHAFVPSVRSHLVCTLLSTKQTNYSQWSLFKRLCPYILHAGAPGAEESHQI